ncbi:hypothetical protein TWF281_005510 [Arthrobotrys megalospora]
MKRPYSNAINFALAAPVLVSLYVKGIHGLIIKVRHYDFVRSRHFDLNLCRPLDANKIILVQEKCEGLYSMPGWRPRFDDSDWTPSRTVVDLFGPPFGPITGGQYEEPRPFAAWSGSLFYNQDPWKPMMFRTSYNPEEGYQWRLSFEVQRSVDDRLVTVPQVYPIAVGDILEPIDNVEDTSQTLLEYPSLVSCNNPSGSGRVLRRAPNFNRPNARIFLDYETIKRHGNDNCLTVKLIVSDLGYTDPAAPVLPPVEPYPLPLDPTPEESLSSDSGAHGGNTDRNSRVNNLDESQSSSAYGTSSDGNLGLSRQSTSTISEPSSQESDGDDLYIEEFEDDPEWQALKNELNQEWARNGQPLEDINMDDVVIDETIRRYLASPEAENFDDEVLRHQLEDAGSMDALDMEISRLELALEGLPMPG